MLYGMTHGDFPSMMALDGTQFQAGPPPVADSLGTKSAKRGWFGLANAR